MTSGLRRLFGPTCCALALAACGGDEGGGEGPPQEPLVIESPRTRVVVGADTMLVFGPTVFTYIGLNPGGAEPSASVLAGVQAFQTSVQAARTPLGSLGVRLEAVTDAPQVLDVETDDDDGPPLAGAAYGYLFVDGVGHVRRVATLTNADQMVCIAAETFGLTLDANRAASCR